MQYVLFLRPKVLNSDEIVVFRLKRQHVIVAEHWASTRYDGDEQNKSYLRCYAYRTERLVSCTKRAFACSRSALVSPQANGNTMTAYGRASVHGWGRASSAPNWQVSVDGVDGGGF